MIDTLTIIFVTTNLHQRFLTARKLKREIETLPGARISPEEKSLFFAVIFCNLVRCLIIIIANVSDVFSLLFEDHKKQNKNCLIMYAISSLFWILISHIITNDIEIVKFLKRKNMTKISSEPQSIMNV
ncbi:hypothetical protein GvMRE_IIg550 [endosymbiont GvMRE of Glomus versiforme]|nr:hypothetical protein GvMRE_IIg550 [endosymbiont GvMRE of Glomus versiforme]